MSSQTFGWSDARGIEVAVNRALNTLQRTLSSYLSDAPMVYAGFSQGAILARPLLISNAPRFPVAVLAEGGYNYLSDAKFAQDYRAAGGQRIMILCGTKSCFATASRAKDVLERAGLSVIVTGDARSGHNLNARMQDALRKEWHRLVEGLPGWESFSWHRWPPPSNDAR